MNAGNTNLFTDHFVGRGQATDEPLVGHHRDKASLGRHELIRRRAIRGRAVGGAADLAARMQGAYSGVPDPIGFEVATAFFALEVSSLEPVQAQEPPPDPDVYLSLEALPVTIRVQSSTDLGLVRRVVEALC
ncbi:MAG: hypothetical protein EA397_17480 [Deltaproteobacteria bacterium]|nr:MAG: hypothetical protein EA397_17480 [Deltaproteobacteria bacterium]